MIDRLNPESWRVPDLSDEKISAIMESAKGRVIRRKRLRKIGYSSIVALMCCVILLYVVYPKTSSLEAQIAELHDMLRQDITNKRGEIYLALENNHEVSVREVSYDL